MGFDETFSQLEFDALMAACRARTPPGWDGLTYELLRSLSDEIVSFVLSLFNYMFKYASYPSSWMSTNVTFISKSDGGGYRPISLTSSMCKLFERLIHRRLKYIYRLCGHGCDEYLSGLRAE